MFEQKTLKSDRCFQSAPENRGQVTEVAEGGAFLHGLFNCGPQKVCAVQVNTGHEPYCALWYGWTALDA